MKKTKLAGLEETIITETLSNGLKVFLLPNNKVKKLLYNF